VAIRTLETDAERRAAVPLLRQLWTDEEGHGLPGEALAAVVSMLLGATIGLRADEASAVLSGD
jgi:hypothetical protein